MTTDDSSPPPGFRSILSAVAGTSAVPYGYTITIWSSGTVSTDVLGSPHLLQVLLFLGGAVASFLVVEGSAYGAVRLVGPPPRMPAVALWGHAHWFAAGGAVVAVWGVDHLIGGTGAWPVAGFLATALYLLLEAVQSTLAARGGRAGGTG